jgi:glycosyltransferase involved in cell wall biosynthesis
MSKFQKNIMVIVPAHNEEEFLKATLDGLINQKYKLSQIIVVDDRSQDDTYQIARNFENIHPELFKILKKTSTEYSDHWMYVGEHIAESFNFGVGHLPEKWDAVAKIDADMILDKNFFTEIAVELENNPKIGIFSGVITQQLSEKENVRGGCRVYRRECWMEVTDVPKGNCAYDVVFRKGFAPPLNGWDSYLANKARMLGWENKVLDSAMASMQRRVGGQSLKSRLRANFRSGDSSRRNGYIFIFFIYRFLGNLKTKPYILNSVCMFLGWMWSRWKQRKYFDENVAEWVKMYQRKRIYKILRINNEDNRIRFR